MRRLQHLLHSLASVLIRASADIEARRIRKHQRVCSVCSLVDLDNCDELMFSRCRQGLKMYLRWWDMLDLAGQVASFHLHHISTKHPLTRRHS